MLKKFALLFALVLPLTLTSCAVTTTAQSGGSFCEVAKIITWEDLDTEITRTEIREHNCVGAELCDWPIKGCPDGKE